MKDLEGNLVEEGDVVYILTQASDCGRTRRLMRGKIVEVNGKRCKTLVHETGRVHGWNTAATVIRPLQ